MATAESGRTGPAISSEDRESHLARMMAGLSPCVRDEVDRLGRIGALRAGDCLIEDGKVSAHVGFVRSGTLAMTKAMPDGRTHIIGLLSAGDMYGRVFDGPSGHRVEALTDAVVVDFPRERFEALLTRSPEIERMLLVNVLDELDAAREWLLVLGRPRAAERLAAFLWLLCRRSGPVSRPVAETIDIPLSRTNLARYLGTRPESLSRAFRHLQDRGAIRLITPYSFVVTDESVLSGMSGQDDDFGFEPAAVKVAR